MRHSQQNRRSRGRSNNSSNNNNRKGQNPLTRSFESNGPDVKIRGTPSHIAEKYVAMARDALSSGDPVLAENYLQHAEHYNRIIMTYREQQGLQNGDQAQGAHNTIGRHRNPGDPIDDDPINDDGSEDHVAEYQPSRIGEPQPNVRSGDRDDRSSRRSGQRRDRVVDRVIDRGSDRAPDRKPDRDRPVDRDRSMDRERPADRDRPTDRERPLDRERAVDRERPMDRERPVDRDRRTDRDRDGDHSERDDADRGSVQPVAAEQTSRSRTPRSSPRRARYAETADQPEFLKRPVRRPRSSSDTVDNEPSPPATSDEAAE